MIQVFEEYRREQYIETQRNYEEIIQLTMH
jgi:hypothetical protein